MAAAAGLSRAARTSRARLDRPIHGLGSRRAAERHGAAAAERRDRYRVEAESIPQPEIAAALNSAAFHLDAALRQLEAEVAWHTATGLSVRSAGEVKISMLVLGQLAQAQAAADEAHLGDQIVREFMMNLADQAPAPHYA